MATLLCHKVDTQPHFIWLLTHTRLRVGVCGCMFEKTQNLWICLHVFLAVYVCWLGSWASGHNSVTQTHAQKKEWESQSDNLMNNICIFYNWMCSERWSAIFSATFSQIFKTYFSNICYFLQHTFERACFEEYSSPAQVIRMITKNYVCEKNTPKNWPIICCWFKMLDVVILPDIDEMMRCKGNIRWV